MNSSETLNINHSKHVGCLKYSAPIMSNFSSGSSALVISLEYREIPKVYHGSWVMVPR